MPKFNLKILAGVALLACLAGWWILSAPKSHQTVSVLAWPTSFSPEFIRGFTEKTGIEVIDDNTPSDEITETKALVGHSGYDVMNITGYPYVPHLLSAGAIRGLDRERIPNLALQDPDLLAKFQNEEERKSIGLYYWGTTGIGLSSKALKLLPADADTSSAAVIFDPLYAEKLGKCGLTFLDSPTDVIPLALLYLGADPDDLSEESLERVVRLFDSIRPFIRKFDNTGYKRSLSQGDTCAAVGWSEAIYLSNELLKESGSKDSIKYIIPREGGLIWMSGLVIPSDAPHPENAEAFVNYALSKEAGAALTNAVKIASAIPSSKQLLSREVLDNPITFPKDSSKLHYVKGGVSPEELKRLNRVWERIKTGV